MRGAQLITGGKHRLQDPNAAIRHPLRKIDIKGHQFVAELDRVLVSGSTEAFNPGRGDAVDMAAEPSAHDGEAKLAAIWAVALAV
ncbi:hypothetical protein FQ775_24155 [Nitratireductor mangrovi]|uniref:Uncharacterized protein n=1 Tax=Nitratireductor mangrovi TaxID=2599600 RepID=A0A6H0DYK4_9HYPH|nr:hypothetical protein [Nitratireductor mangrovi]QIS94685.1 hypothetical protein FQ775_24155 [Nitratireductor mangrovi]